MKRSRTHSDLLAYILSLLMVALTAVILYSLQEYIAGKVQQQFVRPFGVTFIFAIAASTWLFGRRHGLLALVWSLLCVDVILPHAPTATPIQDPRIAMETLLLIAVGLLTIYGVEAASRNGQLLAAARSHAARESLLNRLNELARNCEDPDDIQQQAVTELGQALHADRCYFIICDLDWDSATISRDWHTPQRTSAQGRFNPIAVGWDFPALFGSRNAFVFASLDESTLNETQRTSLRAGKIEAGIAAPVYSDDRLVAVLVVTSAEPRKWTPDEVSMAEAVAGHTRAVLESARVRLRERNIAAVLQEALMPIAPSGVPGLRMAAYYRPALNEASVGGDFYDVYQVSGEQFALVVGDVSGKGLAAAVQVAAVRNMLRCLLVVEPSPAVAVSRLNSVLTQQQLLAGFATLFVGVFSCADHTLTYVSCGHEPALVCRAGRYVERLESAGLPLGIMPEIAYEQYACALNGRDTVLIYTDGLTDCGPEPAEYLNVDGLSDLLANTAEPMKDPGAVKDEIVAAAHVRAGGIMRDDVCLLVAMA